MGLPAARVTNDPSNYFAIGLQSAKDSDATTFYFLRHLSGSGFDVDVSSSKERIGGFGREIALVYRTKVTADGQFVSYADPDFIGRVLYGALGTENPIASSGGLYQHTIMSGGSLLPYYTMEQAWADETERTGNCIISDLKLDFEAGKPVKVTGQFVSGGTPHTQSAALSPTRETDPIPFQMPGASLAVLATGQLTNGVGATSIQLTKASVEIKNALDDAIQTNALNRADVTWLTVDFDIDGTAIYTDKKLWEAIQYGGGTQVPTGLLTSGQFWYYDQVPSQQSLQIFAPHIEFGNPKVNRLDPDGKTMYLDFTASTKAVAGTASLQAVVANNTSTLYSSSST